MGRFFNKCVRYFAAKFDGNGLAQESNQSEITGKLVFPEIADAARQMAEEGIVMLKNINGTLPVKENDVAAVFGRTAVDYFTVGYGSGGDVVAPYKIGLMEGLENSNIKVNRELADIYAKWCGKPRNVPDEGYWGHWPMCFPEMPLKEAVVEKASKESSIALVVIGRAAGEDRENLLKKGSYYLTDKEKDMLYKVTKYFKRVCVILDCGNVIDMSWTVEFGDKIGAVLYAWQGGMESGNALAEILAGKKSPSGKLADTIAVNYEAYPSSKDFGNKEYNNYTEDIYVGYRYFETFKKEDVLYPFGFGMSYTTFEIKGEGKEEDGKISLKVKVKNTGEYEGKEVVQVYLRLPQGKLGNPEKVLAAFDKTELLKPQQEQELELSFDLRKFAPYDDSGITGNENCYVLEAGAYKVDLGTSSRDTQTVLAFERDKTEAVEKLSQVMAVKSENAFKRIKNVKGKAEYESVPTVKTDLKDIILSRLPEDFPIAKEEFKFDEVLNGKYTAKEFVSLLTKEELDEITHGQGKMDSNYGVSGNAGAFGGVTEKLRKRGLPAVITTDGPSGIRIRRTVSLLPCGTALASAFNTKGVYELYRLVGKEMRHFGSDMLLAPGMNIHRNPLCGRNFEYFSEDPLLTGKTAAAVISGLQIQGVSACPKHFACNNQEINRNYNDSRVSERALREIYLKGFRIAVEDADPWSIMTSYNKINGVWNHYNYELATTVLRDEWGYKGVVITDWWMREGASPEFPNIRNDAYRVRAQVDVLMPGEIIRNKEAERTLVPSLKDPDGVTMGEAQRSALNVVNFIIKLSESRKSQNQ